jgi:uncharacterized protein (TIGR02145 family)
MITKTGFSNKSFDGASYWSNFWSTTAIDADAASHWRVVYSNNQLHDEGLSKIIGSSIRCVKE